jgi:hypothetical protein
MCIDPPESLAKKSLPFSAESVKQINIQTSSGTVTFESSSDGTSSVETEVRGTSWSRADDIYMNLTQTWISDNSSVLNATVFTSAWKLFENCVTTKVTVYLPADHFGTDVRVNMDDGVVNLWTVSFNSIDVTASNAVMQLEKVTANNTVITLQTGAVHATDVIVDNFNVDAAAGFISLNNITYNTVNASLLSGRIQVETASSRTPQGSMTLSVKDEGSVGVQQLSSGSLQIFVNQGSSDLEVKSSEYTGNFNLQSDKNDISGDGVYTSNVVNHRTTTGTVNGGSLPQNITATVDQGSISFTVDK